MHPFFSKVYLQYFVLYENICYFYFSWRIMKQIKYQYCGNGTSIITTQKLNKSYLFNNGQSNNRMIQFGVF